MYASEAGPPHEAAYSSAAPRRSPAAHPPLSPVARRSSAARPPLVRRSHRSPAARPPAARAARRSPAAVHPPLVRIGQMLELTRNFRAENDVDFKEFNY